MPDPFGAQADNLSSPCSHLAAVAPSDTVDLAVPCRSLWVGTPGNLKVTTLGGEVVTVPDVVGIFPVRVTRVWATATVAAGIVAMW